MDDDEDDEVDGGETRRGEGMVEGEMISSWDFSLNLEGTLLSKRRIWGGGTCTGGHLGPSLNNLHS